jgi:ABC-2 type transport system permease protein
MTGRAPAAAHLAGGPDASAYAGLGIMLRIVWATRRRAIAIWTLVLSGSMIFTAAAVAGLYDTQAKIQGYADAVTSGRALLAINGKVEGINTLGGVIQDEFGFLASILMPLLGISLVAAATRREEEAGRLETLLSGRIGRRQPTLTSLLVAAVAIVVTGGLFAGGLIAAGVPVSGSVLYAASLAMLSFLFAGLAALVAQGSRHARGVYAVSLIVLAVGYVLRGVGDVTGSWLTWLSPLGWQEKVAPFGAQRWWALLIPLGVGLVLGGVAVESAGRRDLGSALVSSRRGPARARPALRTPLGLAAHLHRPAVLGWLAGGVLLTGMLGSLTQQMLDAMVGNSALAEAMGIDSGAALDGFLAATQLYLAVIAAGYVVQAIGTLRSEEAEGRLETRLAGTLSRGRWLAAHALAVLAGLLVVVLGSSLVLAVSAAWSTGDWTGLGATMRAGLAYLPAELVLAGLAIAVFGWRPRWFALAWIGYALTAFVAFLGPALKLGRTIMDLAPTTHVGNPPAGASRPADLVALAALGAALGLVGFVMFRRRGVPAA